MKNVFGDEVSTKAQTNVFGDSIQTPAEEQKPSLDTKSAMFPRTAKGAEEGRSYPRQVLNAGNDLLSLAGRGIASAFDKDRSYKESLADTQGGNIVSKTIRDPGTGAALLTSPISGPLTGAIKAGGLLATLGKMAVTGAVEGSASAASHQAENVGAGKEASLKDAALEVAANTALPVGVGALGEGAGKVLKATGKKILDSSIKASKKLTQGQGSKFDVQNIFDLGLDSPKGIKGLDENIAAYHEDLNNRYGKELESVQGGVFNAGQALKAAIEKSQARLKKGGITPEEEAGIKHGIETWDQYLGKSEFIKSLTQKEAPLAITLKEKQSAGMRAAVDAMNGKEPDVVYSLPAGSMPASAAVAVRRAVQKAAKFDRTDPKAVKGAELFAQDLQSSMNEQLSKKFPGLRKLDAEFAKLHPIERATDDAVKRTEKNYGLSLLDLGGLGVLGLGAGEGDKNTSLSGLALLAATRGARSPGAGSALYRTGKNIMGGSKASSVLSMLAGRGASQNFTGNQ